MTQDEIIRMAREAGFDVDDPIFPMDAEDIKILERFAALVAENTNIEQQREIVRLKGIIEEQANGAQNLVLAEREACVKVCEEGTGEAVQKTTLEILLHERKRIAKAIRNRGDE